MTLNVAGKTSLLASQTDEVWIFLITIDHPDLAEPERFSSDSVATTSRGNLFKPFPFLIKLPNDEEERPPSMSIFIDNVDRTIVEKLRQISPKTPNVSLEIVLHSDPDYVQHQALDFKLKNAVYDQFSIEGDLGLEAFLRSGWPKEQFDEKNWPGVI